jgi:hypothetical protein
MEDLRSGLNDAALFKNIYRYAFDFARVSRSGGPELGLWDGI